MRKIFTKRHIMKYIASIAVLCILRGIMVGITKMAYFDPMFWIAVIGLVGLEIYIDFKDLHKK